MGINPQAVSAIIFKDNQVLLIKRRDIPVWVLPGGGIDKNEPPETAACREVLEETGFTVEIIRKVAEYQPINRLTRITHFYECRILGGKPFLGAETKEINFFPLNSLPKLLPPPYPNWIADADARHPYIIRKSIEDVGYFNLFKHFLLHPFLVLRFLLTKIGIHVNR